MKRRGACTLVAFHDDPDLGANTLVDQLYINMRVSVESWPKAREETDRGGEVEMPWLVVM